MPGAGVQNLTRGKIEDAREGGHEHHVAALFRKVVAGGGDPGIRVGEQPVERNAVACRGVAHQLFGHHHEERRRRSFARHVADEKKQPVAIDKKIIEQIAADFPRWLDPRKNIDVAAFRKSGKAVRQQPELDRASSRQLAFPALQLRLQPALLALRRLPLGLCSATRPVGGTE